MNRIGIFVIVGMFLLGSCASGGSFGSLQSFYDISVGSSAQDVVNMMGTPYAIHKRSEGALEYEYIERFKAGDRNLEEKHLFLLIKEGKVVSKRVETITAPPYIFDSYDMQTTEHAQLF